MRKKLVKVFLFSLLTISILSTNHIKTLALDSTSNSTTEESSIDMTSGSSTVSEAPAGATNQAQIEITEDWEPKEPVVSKPTTSTPKTSRPAGLLPQTGEEKFVLLTLMGLSIVLIILLRKLVQQRKIDY